VCAFVCTASYHIISHIHLLTDNFIIFVCTYTQFIHAFHNNRDMPKCQKCLTHADYIPPRKTAHLFRYYHNRFTAFRNYPRRIPGRAQSKLSMNFLARWYREGKSYLFGLQDSVTSRLALNDWRLKLYLQSDFPDIFRPTLDGDGKYIT
jgi:hypothetical protein